MDYDEKYVEMCGNSPVQNGWKKKVGDLILWKANNASHWIQPLIDDRIEKKIIAWILRQEDWQKLIQDERGFCGMKELNEWRVKNCMTIRKILCNSNKDYWRLVWCLFYHKEVLDLVWNFETRKWVSELEFKNRNRIRFTVGEEEKLKGLTIDNFLISDEESD